MPGMLSVLVRYGLINGLPGFVTLEEGGTPHTESNHVEHVHR